MTDGRVFSGRHAKDLGLVDELGLLEDAVRTTKKMAKAPHAEVIMYKRPYGYGGSIYASTSSPTPHENVVRLELPESSLTLPRGFYYLWQP